MLSAGMKRSLAARLAGTQYAPTTEGTRPRHGDDIFPAGSTVRSFADFVGQVQAIRLLRATVASARARQQPLDHVLLAAGNAGVGKSTLARILAWEMGVGIVEMTGKLTLDDIRPTLLGMQDGDILFLDEIHTLLAGGKAAAEGWLLTLLADGGLASKERGFEPMPRITVVGATTDAQKLTDPFLSRFAVQPVLGGYTDAEGVLIAASQARAVGFGTDLLPMPDDKILGIIAGASLNMPRAMRRPLIALRDSFLGDDMGQYDVDTALEWVGLTRDGLDTLSQEYLMALVDAAKPMSERSMQGVLCEPVLGRTEQRLQSLGFLVIESGGRVATDDGKARARLLGLELNVA